MLYYNTLRIFINTLSSETLVVLLLRFYIIFKVFEVAPLLMRNLETYCAAVSMDPGIHFPVYVLCVYRIANSEQSRETFILSSVRWRQIRNCFSRIISVAFEERHLRRASSDMRNRAAAGTN